VDPETRARVSSTVAQRQRLRRRSRHFPNIVTQLLRKLWDKLSERHAAAAGASSAPRHHVILRWRGGALAAILRPRRHQPAPLLEQVATLVGLIGLHRRPHAAIAHPATHAQTSRSAAQSRQCCGTRERYELSVIQSRQSHQMKLWRVRLRHRAGLPVAVPGKTLPLRGSMRN